MYNSVTGLWYGKGVLFFSWLENLAMAVIPDFLCQSWNPSCTLQNNVFYIQFWLIPLWCAGLWAEVCIFTLPLTLRGCCSQADRLVFSLSLCCCCFFLMYLHFLLCICCQPCSTASGSGIGRVQEATVLYSTLLNGASPTGFWAARLSRWGRKIWF